MRCLLLNVCVPRASSLFLMNAALLRTLSMQHFTKLNNFQMLAQHMNIKFEFEKKHQWFGTRLWPVKYYYNTQQLFSNVCFIYNSFITLYCNCRLSAKWLKKFKSTLLASHVAKFPLYIKIYLLRKYNSFTCQFLNGQPAKKRLVLKSDGLVMIK